MNPNALDPSNAEHRETFSQLVGPVIFRLQTNRPLLNFYVRQIRLFKSETAPGFYDLRIDIDHPEGRDLTVNFSVRPGEDQFDHIVDATEAELARKIAIARGIGPEGVSPSVTP